MFASLFRSNQPAVLVAGLVLVPVLFGITFLRLADHPGSAMPLHELVGSLVHDRAWIQGLLTVLLVLLIGMQLSFLVNDADLMDRRTFLPALIFPLLLAAFGPSHPLDPALTGMPFVLAATHRTLSMNNISRVMGLLFDAGMLFGIAAMFYLPYAFLVVVVWAAVSVIRPFQWREYLVPLMGCAVIFYFAWAIITLTGNDWRPLLTIIHSHDAGSIIKDVPASQRILLLMVLAGMVPVGVLAYVRSYRRGIMRQKNLRSSFLAFTAALVILLVFDNLLTGAVPAVLIAVPLTVFCANALQSSSRAWLGESAVLSLLILALWAQWGW